MRSVKHADSGGLSISANATKTAWQIGETPVVRITLSNTSANELWIPSKAIFGVWEPDDNESLYQAWAIGTDQRGKEMIGACHLDYRGLGSPSYRVLAPGAAITTDHPLRCFDFRPGETFFIRAYYWDRNPSPPKAPSSALPFREKIGSAPARIEILGPK
jgi:hypothetical protein